MTLNGNVQSRPCVIMANLSTPINGQYSAKYDYYPNKFCPQNLFTLLSITYHIFNVANLTSV